MNSVNKTRAGIRTSNFSYAVIFLREVLKLEMVYHDKEKDFAQFKLPSGQILEILGPKNLWIPFTTAPAWEVIIADIWNTEEKKQS